MSHMRKGVSQQVSDLLMVIFLVLGPDHLSYSDRDRGRVGLQGGRGHAQRAEEPK